MICPLPVPDGASFCRRVSEVLNKVISGRVHPQSFMTRRRKQLLQHRQWSVLQIAEHSLTCRSDFLCDAGNFFYLNVRQIQLLTGNLKNVIVQPAISVIRLSLFRLKFYWLCAPPVGVSITTLWRCNPLPNRLMNNSQDVALPVTSIADWPANGRQPW